MTLIRRERMTRSIGVVRQVIGEVSLVGTDGVVRRLVEGERVFVGEQLLCGSDGAVAISLDQGGELTLGRDSSLLLSPALLAGDDAPEPLAPIASAEQLREVEQLQRAIAAGEDPSEKAEAPAAGPQAGANGGRGGGHSFVLLQETGGQLEPDIGFDTGPLALVNLDTEQRPVLPAIEPDVPGIAPDAQPQGGATENALSEAGLAGGSNPEAPTTVSGDLGYSFGADGMGSFTWTLEALPELSTGGIPLSYQLSADGLSLTGEAGGVAIFTLQLNDLASGAYSFTLHWPLDHLGAADANIGLAFSYNLTDGNGSSVAGSLLIGIVDDLPLARDDAAVLLSDQGDAQNLSGNLLANDSPGADGAERISQVSVAGEVFSIAADGSLSSSGADTAASASFDAGSGVLSLSTPTGTLELQVQAAPGQVLGDYSFIANPALAFPESGELHTSFTYQLLDSDGDSSSAELAIQLNHGRPLLVVGSNADDLADASAPHLVPSPLDTDAAGPLAGSYGSDVLIGDAGGVQSLVTPGKNYNIALLVDSSGSMAYESGSGATRIQLTKDALSHLANQLKDHDGVINVQLVPFNSNLATVTHIYGLNAANVGLLLAAIDAIKAHGLTNYEAAFTEAAQWFNQQIVVTGADSAQNFEQLAFILSDGQPTVHLDAQGNPVLDSGNISNFQDVDEALQAAQAMLHGTIGGEPIQVHAISIGSNSTTAVLDLFDNTAPNGIGSVNLPDGTVVTAPAGDAQIVHSAAQLQAVLSGGSTSIVALPLGADELHAGAGNDILFGDTLNTDHLAWLGHPAGSHDGQGYQALLDYLQAGNGGAAPSLLQVREFIAGQALNLDLAGDPRGGNDLLDAGAGNDLLFGQGGNDRLIGGLGDDLLIGGRGQDVFAWNTGEHGHDRILDFTLGGPEGDALDLHELLGGEELGVLADYLNFAVLDNGGSFSTLMSVSANAGGPVIQTIELSGIDLAAHYGVTPGAGGVIGSGADSAQIISGLLGDQALRVDTV
jgi:uncharacterized protein YegL